MKTTDVELIHRVLDGDDTAFTELVKKYQRPVHALVWRKIGDFHIAEELTQDTFLKAYQELATLKKPQSFSSWLYVIAANNCSTWLRKKRLWTESLEGTHSRQLEKATYSGYVVAENERTAVEAQREVIKKLLAKLQESERTVITLRYFGEMSSAEIGAFLGVSANTVRSRLRRAQQRLKEEEAMIREALENFQITPNLTENIVREISRLKPAAPSGGKPVVPWAIGVSAVTIVLLMIGFSNQHLSRFQKPYNFNAASEMKVELIDAPVVRNLETEPDDRTQLGNANAQGENNGTDEQANNAAPLDLKTIITKMKHHHNAVTSVTGDFVMERYRGYREKEIDINEYTLTFAGEKIQMEQKAGFVRFAFYDGERTFEGTEAMQFMFEQEIAPDADIKTPEAIQHIFKQNGIELADDVRIVDDDEPQSSTLIENETDKKYNLWLEGETTLMVYDLNHLEYGVRPGWVVMVPDRDPRWWLTFPKLGSDNSYLSEPLWQLLEKYESEIIGSEVLDGEMTSVIRLNTPAWSEGDFKVPGDSVKLWISPEKGFRLVKSEKSYTIDNRSAGHGFKAGVTYVSRREIAYHEYLPDVWFPKRIENSIVPETSPEQQAEGEDFIFKNVLITKQCRLNTDVTELLNLRLPFGTSVFVYGTGKPSTIGDVLNPVSKPDIRKLFGSSAMPGSGQQVYNPAVFDLETLITKMKQTDSSVVSGSGDFVIAYHNEVGIAKTAYSLTFEGDSVRVEREWGPPLAAKDYPLIDKVFPTVELDDGERRWEIYRYKKLLFSVEIARDKPATVLETIRQAFKQQEIALAADVRITASEAPDNYTLIENQTGKSYFIVWAGEMTLKVYDLQHTEYRVRHPFRRKMSERGFQNIVRYKVNMLSDLDPRYWLTYPSAGGQTYLTEPLSQLLEKHDSELLGSEMLDGEETSVIRLKLPDESLILWISHDKGFHLVKLQRAFPIEDQLEWPLREYFQSGDNYIETREIAYQEYLPDVWFPKKIERSFTPIDVAGLPDENEVPLKTVIHTKQCRLNTDVAESLRLNLSPDTSVFSLKPADDTPVAEKMAYLRQEIPRVLKHRLDLLKLRNELAIGDPNLTLLIRQTEDEVNELRWGTIFHLILEYQRFSPDSSAIKPGGDFYELLQQNNIFFRSE